MEHSFIFLLNISIIYFVSFLFSLITKKIKQPNVLGYILGGLLLGILFGTTSPFIFISKFFCNFKINGESEILFGLSQIGVVLLLFLAGIETNVNELKKAGIKSAIVALSGIIISGFLIGGIYFILNNNIAEAIFMAVMGTATSVSVSVQTLREIDQLKNIKGLTITGAAIIDDIIGILLVTFLIAIFANEGKNLSINLFNIILLKILIFFIIVFILGFFILKILKIKKIKIFLEKIPCEFVVFSLFICFLLSYIANCFGVATIIGAYFSGLIISMTDFKSIIFSRINYITKIFFTPIFFTSIGLTLNLLVIKNVFIFGIIISIIAVLGKILGCGIGAKISGFDIMESIQIGTGMVPRGEVTLIIAALGISKNILTSNNFAVGVLIVLFTAISTPILLKIVFKKRTEFK